MSELRQKKKSSDQKSVEPSSQLTHVPGDYIHSSPKSDKNASSQCKHPTHQNAKTAAFVNLLPTEHWTIYGQQPLGEIGEDVPSDYQAHEAINQKFQKRLEELESRVPNALEAQLETYKDWVSMLQQLNQGFIKNFNEFQKSVEHHLEVHETRSNYSYRQDVATLVRLIRQAYHYNDWSLAGMKFETMTPAFVMGLDENNPHDMSILEKLLKGEYQPQKEQPDIRKKNPSVDMNVMALAMEVTEKHDEISRLKQQLFCLEDEIQNAQKKIQLKDDVIRELRWDLKNLNKSLIQESPNTTSVMSTNNTSGDMTPVNFENKSELLPKPSQASNSSVNKSCTNDSKLMVDKLDCVKNQLQAILTSTGWQVNNSTRETEQIQQIFTKLQADRAGVTERLVKMKEHLLDMLGPNQREEHTSVMHNNDEMLIQAVHDNFESINLAQKELSHQVEELLMEKGEMSGKIQALNKMNQVNCDVLKELADLLSSMLGETLNYNEIYGSSSPLNPFCQAVCRINSKLMKSIEELKAKLDAEKEKHLQSELEIAELEKSNEQGSHTQFGSSINSSPPSQNIKTSKQH